MSREFLLPVRVYIEDTDAGGIVYYVNYLKYFERARTEFMRTLGYDKAAFLGGDTLFPSALSNTEPLEAMGMSTSIDIMDEY